MLFLSLLLLDTVWTSAALLSGLRLGCDFWCGLCVDISSFHPDNTPPITRNAMLEKHPRLPVRQLLILCRFSTSCEYSPANHIPGCSNMPFRRAWSVEIVHWHVRVSIINNLHDLS